jgi:uncharacterized phosphosugar-binding protein
VSADAFFATALDHLERVRSTQADAIHSAAEISADAIGGGKLVHTFGTGHGSMPALEAFPRSGGLVGFHPIVESPITLLHHVWGDMGVPQYRFLHRQEGYGRAILEAHRPDPADALILFSHSGINPVILDLALGAQELGMRVVGVTSKPHSSSVESRHSSGKRLYEVADVVVDSGAPLGDAAVRIEGLDDPVSAVSTVLVVSVMQAIVAETAALMVERGQKPHIEVNLNLPRESSAREHNDTGYDELWERLARR